MVSSALNLTENQQIIHTCHWDLCKPWLTLHLVKGLGSLRIAKLIEYFGSPETALKASTDKLCSLLSDTIARNITHAASNTKIINSLNLTKSWLNHSDSHHLICPDHPFYPEILKELPDYPPVLFLSGNIELLKTPKVAIVGSRRPSLQGKRHAKHMGKQLSQMGITITSGMATGIDAEAHYGALTGSKASIAVIGTGIDKVYPASNLQLAKKLREQGLIISEFPLGTPPVSGNFPKRNRIISGLSLGVLVIEAAEKSGSLITARLALEQGREVFATPGFVNNPMTKGCHQLIRQGAMLIDEPKQVIEELKSSLENWILTPNSTTQPLPTQQYKLLDQKITCPLQRRLMQAIGSDTLHVDELLIYFSEDQSTLTAALTILELNGYIVMTSGGYRRL